MRSFHGVSFAGFFLLMACAGSTAGAIIPQPYNARGSEPGWSLTVQNNTLKFMTMDGQQMAAEIKNPNVQETPEGLTYAMTSKTETIRVSIRHRSCQDAMSGFIYPDHVAVMKNEKEYRGCGGPVETPVLTHTSWTATDINGNPVPEKGSVTLVFNDSGKLAGRSGCNRYSAEYKIEGTDFQLVSPMISTKMACPQPAMAVEGEFHNIMASANRAEVRQDGMLVISTPDNRFILFTPAE